ncbi:hypothetical protein [Allorhizocola rhizosphaerae]|uniref:hypothetical protein n=1 Tax=Allorhizocola rhizosphaerae TaxID=1872709 RepID=UPI0013C312A3|nr:hypothetical protein [Allorhizocola rhizosphaerae]
MRYPTVRVAVGPDGKVITVAVAGRPRPHPFGAYEGSHLTPWSVFVDSVRRAAVGWKVSTAAREVRWLLEQLDTEDGESVKLLAHPRSTWFNTIIEDGWDVLEDARRTSDIAKLQKGIAMYLTGRNLAPMTAAFLGPDQARGRGEPAALRKLRDFESGERQFTPKELRALMVGLLDEDALRFISTRGDTSSVPGIILHDRAEAVRDTVIAHLRELTYAYPLAYDASRLATTAGFNAAFKGITLRGGTQLPETQYEWEAAPAGWSTSSSNACLANIELVKEGNTHYIDEIHLDGRGNTLLNTQGHHVTAHIAIEAAVRQTVVNRTIPDAMAQMLALADRIGKLATWPASAPSPKIDPKGIFANALVTFEAAKDAAKAAVQDATSDLDLLPELEGLIGAYIMMRNAMPMAAVLRGATADAKAEGQKMGKLWAWDEDPTRADPAQVCWTLWKMLDLQALSALGEMDDGTTQKWAPGASATPEERVLHVLSVHLDTMTTAFPELVKRSHMRTTGAVKWVLNGECALAVPAAATKFLSLTQHDVSPVSPFKSHAKKVDEEAEWDEKPKPKQKRRAKKK